MLLRGTIVASLICTVFCAQQDILTRDTSVLHELKPFLSAEASIVVQGAAEFDNLTRRWDKRTAPNFNSVVVAATEQDVQETVRYAKSHEIPIVAFAGGHGSTETLQTVRGGIEIRLRKLNHLSIGSDGETATMGGGIKAKEVTSALWAARKRTVTGMCECVGMVAPLLGGGHGALQGYYGLMTDQLVSARLVLANGSAISVSSNEHPDLFWALRGAGHNFGIVTEFTYRIYDAELNKTWAWEQFVFTGDRLEDVYRITNEMVASQPVQVMNYGIIIRVPQIDPINPIISYFVLYDGSSSDLRDYTASLHSLGAVSVTTGEVSYTDLPGVVSFGEDDMPCQPTESVVRFPVYAKTYNLSSLRAVYDEFSQGMQRQPAFNNSLFLLEDYAQAGVRAISPDSTAFAHRSERLLLSSAIFFPLEASLEEEAIEWGKNMRDMLQEGTGERDFRTYVNYAHGDESQEALYGSEPWRLEKLFGLKQLYDPDGMFSYYAPLIMADKV